MTEKTAVTDVYDEGFDLFKASPELTVVEVWWRACRAGWNDGTRARFVEGYVNARLQHDDYMRSRQITKEPGSASPSRRAQSAKP